MLEVQSQNLLETAVPCLKLCDMLTLQAVFTQKRISLEVKGHVFDEVVKSVLL